MRATHAQKSKAFNKIFIASSNMPAFWQFDHNILSQDQVSRKHQATWKSHSTPKFINILFTEQDASGRYDEQLEHLWFRVSFAPWPIKICSISNKQFGSGCVQCERIGNFTRLSNENIKSGFQLGVINHISQQWRQHRPAISQCCSNP